MAESFGIWLNQVRDALQSINMALEDWQSLWPFDFEREYRSGTRADDAAMKANRYWWHQQNVSLKQECRETPDCWLPHGHRGSCEPVSNQVESGATMPTYAPGDYVKVEFQDKTTGIGEWMWVRVSRCDDQRQLVFGTLDNQPLNDYGGQIELGSELAVSYSQIREHRKPTEFTQQ